MDEEITQRGFELIKFKDTQGAACSLQMSSSAEESKIWLGTDDADPRVLVKYEGWVPVAMPDGVLYNTRMHLNRQQVQDLLPYLLAFAETGALSSEYQHGAHSIKIDLSNAEIIPGTLQVK